MNGPVLSVIIPVYNEEKTIQEIINRVKEVDLKKEIIVVDDCSEDMTYQLLQNISDVTVLRHGKNRGKGAAIRSGLKEVTGNMVIIQDADLEYDPHEYKKIIEVLKKGEDVIFGSRFKGESSFKPLSYLANRILTILTNFLFGARLTDMETCYKCFRTEVLKDLELKAEKFEFEPEVTVKLLKEGYRIKEIPISYRGRREGKKIGAMDGIQAVLYLLRMKFFGSG